jgi:hypothetical protein
MRFPETVLGMAAVAGLAVSPAYAGSHAPTVHSKAPTSTVTAATTATASTTPHSTTPPKLNPIAAKISVHPQLNAKITALLPAGMTLNQASSGFKNQGQFIAALHVSHNLALPFAVLKADMTKKHMSLGQAIQSAKGSSLTTASTAARTADHETQEDLKTGT